MKYLLAILFFLSSGVFAATVVTQDERITGTITAQTDQFLTIRPTQGAPRVIARAKVLQIFDDKGELSWQGNLPAKTDKPLPETTPLREQQPEFAQKSILLDFYIGTALGGFYSEENRLIDALGITAIYNDGTSKAASTSMFTVGGGLSYQSYSSLRWSNLISYVFRSTAQTTSAGDGDKYQKKTFSNQTITTLHALMIGKEIHFYPGENRSSWDFIGQVGYEFGNYKPLAGFNGLQSDFPTLPKYIGTSDMIIHGPTARIGTGFTFRGSNWQFRLLGFYQVAYLFGAEAVNFASVFSTKKDNLVHDVYAAISLGYGW